MPNRYCNALLFVDEETLCTYRRRPRDASGIQGKGAWVKFWTLKRDEKGRVVGSVQDKIVVHLSDATAIHDLRKTENNTIVCLLEGWTSTWIVEIDRRGKKLSETKIKRGMSEERQEIKKLYDASLQTILTLEMYQLRVVTSEMFLSFFDLTNSKYESVTLDFAKIKHAPFTGPVQSSVSISPCKKVAAVVVCSDDLSRRITTQIGIFIISTRKERKVLNQYFARFELKSQPANLVSKFACAGQTLVVSVLGSKTVLV